VVGSLVTALVLVPTVAVAAPASPPRSARTAAPAKWDPRVRELVRFVERERKLEFDHPIDVEFLDDAAFVAALAVDATEEDRRLDRLYAGDLFALGLVGPGLDLTETVDELSATSVSGFYDDEEQELKVRGQDLDDVVVRATLVHELTHALQDQTFHFEALRRRAKSSGADFAGGALIEGDATWIEEAYVATLPVDEQDAYYAAFDLSSEAGPDADVDPESASFVAIDLLLSTPYSLGYSFVDYLRSEGGAEAVDDAFRDPPPSDEHVVDPVAHIRRERPFPPGKPKLRRGESKRGGADEIGVVQLYFTLASRLAPREALAAVTGWKGDTYIGFSREDAPCIRAAIVTDDVDEAIELVDALEEWAGRGPASAATAGRRGATVDLEACGAVDAPVPTEEVLIAASDALSTRYLVFAGIREASARLTPQEVRCFVDLQVTDPELLELLFAPEITPAERRLLDRRSDDLAGRCGLVPEG